MIVDKYIFQLSTQYFSNKKITSASKYHHWNLHMQVYVLVTLALMIFFQTNLLILLTLFDLDLTLQLKSV
jgi:hypothetical protein